MLSKQELLKGRDLQYPADYTQEISDNLDKLLVIMNQIRSAYGISMTVNSGWRPPSINSNTPGAAKHSKHMLGLACDIADPDGSLWAWTINNLQLMKDLGIFMEHKWWTSSDSSGGWVHYQLSPSNSGKRIFVPSNNPPKSKKWWDGNYEEKYDE